MVVTRPASASFEGSRSRGSERGAVAAASGGKASKGREQHLGEVRLWQGDLP